MKKKRMGVWRALLNHTHLSVRFSPVENSKIQQPQPAENPVYFIFKENKCASSMLAPLTSYQGDLRFFSEVAAGGERCPEVGHGM